MSKDVVFTVKLESALRDEFMAEAAAVHRPASQLVRDFMRDFVQRQREQRSADTPRYTAQESREGRATVRVVRIVKRRESAE